MKSYLKLFVAVFFILAAVKTVKADYYTVSGKVRYADNNEIVTHGTVKLYDSETCELVAVGQIEPTGDYLLGVVRTVHNSDIIGLPNVEPEMDWVATGYPDKTNPQHYTHVDVNQNLTGIDVYVQRIQGGESLLSSNVSGLILDMNKKPVTDAMVYAMIGDKYFGYGLSDSKGNFNVKNIPLGNYIIIAHKLGSQSVSSPVTVTENGLSGLNFVMNKSNQNIITTPVQFKLSQNFPNPFNPSTTINYVIPANGLVSIKVYNSLGQLASTLVNEVKVAGSYEVSFDASSLSSGVYFYRLDVRQAGSLTGSYTETKKMTLIK